jgi:hypothetical protein
MAGGLDIPVQHVEMAVIFMGYYIEGEPVKNICLKNGEMCIIDGNVRRLLKKEKRYVMDEPGNVKKVFQGYTAVGLGTQVFVDVDPLGSHEIKRLLPK